MNNRTTPLKVRSTTPEEEVMEAMEDMKEEKDTEAMEEVEEEFEEHLAKDEDWSSVIIVDNKVTSHETVRQLLVPTTKLPITLLKNV